MEGGEWSNFNAGVCVNEEADFMAQLFPNPNDVEVGYGHQNDSSNNYHNSNSNANGSSYYSSDSSTSNYFSQLSSFRNPHVVGYYQIDCFSDNSHENHNHVNHALAATPTNNNPPTLPIDFLQCHIDDDKEVDADVEGANLKEEPPAEAAVAENNIKTSDSSENLKKRPKPPTLDLQAQKGKRNVKAKKSQQKLTLGGGDEEEEIEAPVNGQSSSSGSLEDDCSSKGTSAGAALNSSGKTRASRGSATDPQSLYARKRRERINERLRILQGLVPNGTKVDISTMLEEAVHYVKFLQLQIKLLSSDEMWMYAPIAYNGMSIGLDFNNLR